MCVIHLYLVLQMDEEAPSGQLLTYTTKFRWDDVSQGGRELKNNWYQKISFKPMVAYIGFDMFFSSLSSKAELFKSQYSGFRSTSFSAVGRYFVFWILVACSPCDFMQPGFCNIDIYFLSFIPDKKQGIALNFCQNMHANCVSHNEDGVGYGV
jgi:hypothetical protein